MNMKANLRGVRVVLTPDLFSTGLLALAADYPAPQAGNFVVKDFQFNSGEKLAEVKLHHYTLGAPQKDASGKVRNAVLKYFATSKSWPGPKSTPAK
jgi:hypothetical protein